MSYGRPGLAHISPVSTTVNFLSLSSRLLPQSPPWPHPFKLFPFHLFLSQLSFTNSESSPFLPLHCQVSHLQGTPDSWNRRPVSSSLCPLETQKCTYAVRTTGFPGFSFIPSGKRVSTATPTPFSVPSLPCWECYRSSYRSSWENLLVAHHKCKMTALAYVLSFPN